MRKGREGGEKRGGLEKNGKDDGNSGHYVFASSRPPKRRPLERRTLTPRIYLTSPLTLIKLYHFLCPHNFLYITKLLLMFDALLPSYIIFGTMLPSHLSYKILCYQVNKLIRFYVTKLLIIYVSNLPIILDPMLPNYLSFKILFYQVTHHVRSYVTKLFIIEDSMLPSYP